MRLPMKRTHTAQILSLPDLAGGLNMRDGISEVLDNQLTDCKNMWWNEGALKTRAALYQNDSEIVLGSASNSTARIRLHNCYNTSGSTKGQLCSVKCDGKIEFFWNYGKSMSKLPPVSESPNSYFVCQYSNLLYCFTVTKKIYRCDISKTEDLKWETVTEEDLYIPKVMMQCRKNKAANISSSQVSGVMLEGYNLLSDYYQMSYNSYNPEIVTEENEKHKMQYHLLKNVKGYTGKYVKVEFTYNGIVYTHEITIDSASNTWKENNVLGDGLKMEVWKNRITFKDKENNIATISDNPEAKATITTDGEDDIVITAPYVWSEARKRKIFNMTRCEWFGGSAGLMGGTRLFLCGNSKTANADLVVWSGLNNPLYFPENSYFYVGNETGAVTGFGKQSDKLIIFKENETWFTTYEQNTNITAEDLVNQNVIDYASSSVYFPLTQINANIGCPYPETIQLCRNRLVWLGNNNSVYTLVSESQYNERSIFSVSEMVKRKIKSISKSAAATACDWDGYYCLFLGGKMLIMDYNCYGYTHVANYSKSEDANVHIPWYYWEISKGYKLMVIGEDLCAVNITKDADKGEFHITSYYFDQKGGADVFLDLETKEKTSSPIKSAFKTKIFDFGLPHIRKNVEQVNLQLANNGGETVNVSFITENGTEVTDIVMDENASGNYTAAYIESRAVFPCIKQVIKFGLKLESNAVLAVDSIILKYRTVGGAR